MLSCRRGCRSVAEHSADPTRFPLTMDIRYVAYEDIDRQLYNSCVHYAHNGRAWGYKWYLEATARRFDVLVEGGYESVMPLVHEANWLGRTSLTTPIFTPALGVFSVHVLSQKRLGYFLREASARFDHVDYAFTGEPSRNTDDVDWAWTPQRNLVVDIDGRPYDELAEQYGSDLLRSLQRSDDADLLVHGNQKPERVAAFMAEHYPDGQRLQHPLLRILYQALHRGWGWTTAVTDRAGELLATNAFVFTHGRITSIAPCASPRGREVGALELLFDYALRQAAGRPIKLDFASTDEGRYTGFGASPERYWHAAKQGKLLGVLPI